ncbi:uncharacterized protein LOC108433950 isoform X3 [Pygocentrus nattereri]|uniref:uncharacterized protein LOC108433950 isoform X3 n=1 Tax=Pygocentrus nattereri TaxID=42514 RepID=UPI0008146D31|nr:uncharacterized protein LOC108433950 isoform X3 [Pygocentrus nattereri]
MEPENPGMALIMAPITLCLAICLAAVMNKLRKIRLSQEHKCEASHLNRSELTISNLFTGTLVVAVVLIGILYTLTVGQYLFMREDKEVTLGEVDLREKDPHSPSISMLTIGEEEVSPCVGRLEVVDSEAEFVQWKIKYQTLLHSEKAYTGMASLSQERILQENISLVLKNTNDEHQGLYLFMKDEDIRLATRINLTLTAPHSPSTVVVKAGEEVDLLCFGRVDWFGTEAEFVQWKMKDHIVLQWEKGSQIVGSQFKDIMARLEVGFGSSVLLPLHTVSPVIVSFLPDGGNGSVRVCEVEKEQMECGAAYSHRIDLQQHSLELRKLSMEDSGTFSVMERETQHTVSVLFIQVFPPSTGPLEEAERGGRTMTIISVIAVVIVMVMGMLRCWATRNWQLKSIT